jgi:hypothetical protein
VSWGTTPGAYTDRADVQQVLTYTVAGLTAGQRYYFTVQAYDEDGLSSPYAVEVSTQVPGVIDPTVVAVSPQRGSVSGGAALAITGTGFAANATVWVGGAAATGVTVLNATTITAVAPAHVAGAVSVRVVNADGGEGTLARGFIYLSDDETDRDADGLPDSWERAYGLDTEDGSGEHGATGDPDHDGASNEAEYRNGTHPRGLYRRYFAEGISSSFFSTVLALSNPNDEPAAVVLQFFKDDGGTAVYPVTLTAHSRFTLDARSLEDIADVAFSTAVESDRLVVADRTVSWDTTGYGGHAETGVEAPATVWYLAEGATHSGFDLFYLLQNPTDAAAQIEVRYLLPKGGPIVKTYQVAAHSRYNIWVDFEDVRLKNTDISAVITSLNAVPVIVERSMYQSAGNLAFGAGHNSAGITQPATTWFLAEGATGDFFDMFVLIANPTPTAAEVKASFLLPNGTTIEKRYVVEGNSRFNIWVDYADARLAKADVSTSIESVNGVPLVVERTMWWGSNGAWVEAHNAPATTVTGTRWALAEGETGGAQHRATYILLANTSTHGGDVRVRLLFEDGTTVGRDYTVQARSRFSVDVAGQFPAAVGRRFGAVIESLGATPVQLVVERAMYWDANGEFWAAGTGALATPLPEAAQTPAATTAQN